MNASILPPTNHYCCPLCKRNLLLECFYWFCIVRLHAYSIFHLMQAEPICGIIDDKECMAQVNDSATPREEL